METGHISRGVCQEFWTQNNLLTQSAHASLLKTTVFLGGVITTPGSLLQETYLNTIGAKRSEYLASLARLRTTLAPEAKPLLDDVNTSLAEARAANIRVVELVKQEKRTEAAKAGDHGKGFAVVADEVRKLATRSSQATVDIERLIRETHEAVEGGVSSVQTTSGLMDHIHNTITSIASHVREIGAAATEQSSTGGEIARRMDESAREVGQNATATQQLSATVQDIGRTASRLTLVSETMALAVGRFQV